jgi:heavy metal sensor kinase
MGLLRPKSVRIRLTLWYVGTLIIILVLYSTGLYLFLQRSLFEEIDRKLKQDFEASNDAFVSGELAKTIASLKRDGAQDRWLIEILDLQGKLLASLPQEDQSPLGPLPASCGQGDVRDFVTADGLNLRVKCGSVRGPNKNYFIRVARPVERIHGELRDFLELILIGLPLAVVMTAIGGYFLSRKMLRPISMMTGEASRISAERLSDRLSIENPDDELGKLAMAFNSTFSRLERTFGEMRRFTADASHELRTPLTIIRTAGEVSLRNASTASEYRDTIANILEETDRLRHLVDSLLSLSRADAGQFSLHRERADISEMCEEIVSHLSVLSEEKQQSLKLLETKSVFATVDRTIFRQAIINITHNAIKYCEHGTTIEMRVSEGPSEVVIEITDNGPGIAPQHQAKLFDRFYRVDEGRSRKDGGSGLGLSIARWAVEANGGSIELSSQVGQGSTFRIHLKKGDATS